MEQRRNNQLNQIAMRKYLNDDANKEEAVKLRALQSAKDQEGVQAFFKELQPKINAIVDKMDKFTYSDAAIKDYSTIGGTPHLDGNYTVFGEVIEGLDVIDKIADAQLGAADRPVKDIKMTMKVVK